MRTKSLPTILLVFIALTGCTNGFRPRINSVTGPMPTAMDGQKGVQVSVEEFVSATKARRVFDADIAREGVLALFVAMKNSGNTHYNVWRRQIKVSLDGEALKPIPAYKAARQVSSPGFFWHGITSLAGLPVGVFLDPTRTKTFANRAIEEHYEKVEFADRVLKPGNTAGGFTYFELPNGWLLPSPETLEKLSVDIELEENTYGDEDGKPLHFKMPLPSLRIS